MIKLLWMKLNSEAAIPTKTNENIGYDIYGIYEEGIDLEIPPHCTKMIPTGLAVAICYDDGTPNFNYALIAKDRGSTGSIGLHTYCGVIDAGYRGEIFIAIHNSNEYPVYFTDKLNKAYVTDDALFYPKTKAIAQLILVKDIKAESVEVDEATFAALCNTKRGTGALGSSGK